jgi:uncharacterized protein (TIGR02284 family)
MRRSLLAALAGACLLLAGCGDKAKDGDPKYDQGKNDRAEDLNELLRGELSAVETYNQAIDRFGSEPGADDLKRLRTDHQDAVALLKDLVMKAGGSPATSSGAWGDFAKAIEGGAKLFGNDAAFSALKQGEEHGVSEYESALKDEDLTESDKSAIRDRLLPKVREHAGVLDNLRKRT